MFERGGRFIICCSFLGNTFKNIILILMCYIKNIQKINCIIIIIVIIIMHCTSGPCVTFALSVYLTGIVLSLVYFLVPVAGSWCKGPLCHVNGESYNYRIMRTYFHSVQLSIPIMSAKPDRQTQTQQDVPLSLHAHILVHTLAHHALNYIYIGVFTYVIISTSHICVAIMGIF